MQAAKVTARNKINESGVIYRYIKWHRSETNLSLSILLISARFGSLGWKRNEDNFLAPSLFSAICLSDGVGPYLGRRYDFIPATNSISFKRKLRVTRNLLQLFYKLFQLSFIRWCSFNDGGFYFAEIPFSHIFCALK